MPWPTRIVEHGARKCHEVGFPTIASSGNCLTRSALGQKPELLVPKQRDAYRAASDEMPDDSRKTI
jgi:hypothetical protein